jgi:hypothetical protein
MQTSTGIDAEKSKLRKHKKNIEHYEKNISTEHGHTQEAPPTNKTTTLGDKNRTSTNIGANLSPNRCQPRHETKQTSTKIDANPNPNRGRTN